jgi:uncharacterized RDD family membrane protein YckC
MNPQQPPTPAPPPMSWQAPEPEMGPAPGVRFASHGPRLIAYIIDSILIGVIVVVATIVFGLVFAGAVASDSAGAVVGGTLLYVIVILAVSLAYFPWFWARGGQTPGMKMFRLRVVRDADGGQISGVSAVLRLFGFWVNSVVFYIGFIWIFVDKRRRGWHDLIAGTVVIEQ